jgi:hypothetical protein
MPRPDMRVVAEAMARASCAKQGIEFSVSDPAVLRKLAVLLAPGIDAKRRRPVRVQRANLATKASA